MSKVFIIPFHVKPLENSIMPANQAGAYVSCYCCGETYVEATRKALQQLNSDGLHPEEILQPIHEMDSNSWSEHIQSQWPDYIDNLPEQIEFDEEITAGNVVYGPLASYNPS